MQESERNNWLNSIEPAWVHGKRNVVEHDGRLSARQLQGTDETRASIKHAVTALVGSRMLQMQAYPCPPE